MIGFLRGTLARLITLGVITLVLLAVLVTAFRVVLPSADQYRERVAAVLSDRLGYPVRMAALSIGLSGWTPRLRLQDVALLDPRGGPDVLSLAALELDLDPLASLRLGSPQIRALTLVGARLVLHRLADGRMRIQGLGAVQSDDPRTLELFLRQGRLNLADSEVTLIDDRMPGGLPRLTEVQLRVRNQGLTHQLDLRARPVPETPTDSVAGPVDARLRLLAELDGDGLSPDTWGGSVYLRLSGSDALAWVPSAILDPRRARAQHLELEAWLQLQEGGLKEGLARVDLGALHLDPPPAGGGPAPGTDAAQTAGRSPGTGPLAIACLSALVRVAPAADGWVFGIRDLGLTMEGSKLTGLDLDLGLATQGRLERLEAAADGLDLALIAPLMRQIAVPLPESLPRIDALGPQGHLTRIAFLLERPAAGPLRWRLGARGDGVGVQGVGEVPGIEGLSLRLRADQDGGELRLGSEWLRVDLAPRFDRPLYFDRFSGILGWALDPDGALHLTGRNLVLENPDLGGRVRFNLDLPAPGGLAGDGAGSGVPGPFLDLRASFHDGNGAATRTYLPAGVLNRELVHWLEGALAGGWVPQADLALRGPVRDYPFREHQGRFELLLEFEDAGLNYLKGWPPITAATGSLHFLNQGMEIRVDSGRILDSTLTGGRAVMLDLWGPHHLSIHGEADGPLSDGLRILAETPLAKRLGALAQGLDVEGVSHVSLDLEVPLKKGQPLSLAGRLTWPGPAAVGLKGTPLTLTDLAGDLRFTERTLTADAIAGHLWGQPLVLAIATRSGRDSKDSVTEISARSRIPVSYLAEHLPAIAWSLARGEADWDLGLALRNADLSLADAPLTWRLRTDLRGLALDLPPPLGKTAAQARPLELEGDLLPGRSLHLRGGAGDLGLDLIVDLAQGQPRLQRGRVVLGADGIPDGSSEGLQLEGSLRELDLPTWGDWWSSAAQRLGSRARGGPADRVPGPRPLVLDLSIDRLGLGTAALTDARIRASPRDPGWTLAVASRELAGDLIVPDPGSETPLELRLEWLELASLLPPQDPGKPPPPTPSGASRVPALDLRVADLRWEGESLGRLALDLRPEPGSLRVPRIELQAPGDTRVSGDAAWVDGPEGGRSRLSLDLQSSDTGPLLRALDYRSALSEAPLESRVRLAWPGALGSFALVRSNGTIDLKVGAGRLLEVEPGVGRVLGILNLGALSRRLALDFTDLYQQGFSFERISGDIRVGGGQAELRRFEIEGPASAIRVSGFTDLRSRTFDQTVTVEPRIGSSIALASALAGGPVVGATVYLADKVTGGAIDKLGSYRYRVTGPWNQPELTRLGWGPFSGSTPPETRPAESPGSDPGSFIPPPSRPAENHFLE